MSDVTGLVTISRLHAVLSLVSSLWRIECDVTTTCSSLFFPSSSMPWLLSFLFFFFFSPAAHYTIALGILTMIPGVRSIHDPNIAFASLHSTVCLLFDSRISFVHGRILGGQEVSVTYHVWSLHLLRPDPCSWLRTIGRWCLPMQKDLDGNKGGDGHTTCLFVSAT